jgi:hypothetical protein
MATKADRTKVFITMSDQTVFFQTIFFSQEYLNARIEKLCQKRPWRKFFSRTHIN